MRKRFIPIIGTISAGKSTFLKSFLGIEVLETGVTTTTKFVCIIKNSPRISFYHVILSKQYNGYININKEGKEIKDIQKIKKKIEEINNKLTEKKGNRNEIFYMLEIPIKNIKNETLLNNCYFMDIPGLNENNSNYIEDIFSLITINDILFEIIVFDSTSIGSDNILNIFKKLEKKNCLKKENNLYILNKMDLCNTKEEEIVDLFKQYFYENFEDEKKIYESSRININFYKNHFIPMNSLLYEAETKFDKDFYSLLLIELFSYISYTNSTEIASFLEYLEKRIEVIICQNNIDIENLEDKLSSINEDSNDMGIIKKSIEKINEIKSTINVNSNFVIGINLEKSKSKKILKKFYLIHKLKMYKNFIHSKFYNNLQETINNIIIKNNNIYTSPIITSEKETKECSILDEMNAYVKEKLRNKYSHLNSYIPSFIENLYEKKIRISFIGNISVGKSTVLNSIIGEDILPTKDTECTYRGIIIKHKNIDNFLLYRTKIEVDWHGNSEFYNFKEQSEPYCQGIKNIKSYLKNKNNDKKISDNDAFIIIQGKLKIFNFIHLNDKLIEKIEFIDLPGHDRQNNTFNNNRYYEKILKYSNCCIYINEAKTIDDEDSVKRMKTQYSNDKQKLYHTLQPKFIYTCLFLINKCDCIPNKEDRDKIKQNLIKIVKDIEHNVSSDNINISFYSGKSLNYFLEYYKIFVEYIEKKPLLCLNYLHNEWLSDKWYKKDFKNYIINRIADKIEEKFDFELEKNEVVPEDFYNKMKNAFNELFREKYRGINEKDEDEIIKILYYIYLEFKNKNFTNTNYSIAFFNKLKEIILFSDNLQKDNINQGIKNFMSSRMYFYIR